MQRVQPARSRSISLTTHPHLQNMFGILNLNKPTGCTSRDVVNRVQRQVKPAKVGHAGTLDPLAKGVLIVCIGPATRLISYVQEMPKQYHATFLLGQSSPSHDSETEVTQLTSPTIPTLANLEATLPRFLGSIQQIPPAYSALKIKGQRAYHLARKGEQVELKPRTIQIYELEILAYEYPQLKLNIQCGSGTYVRSLGRDMAEALGTEAIMSALTRTAIGPFQAKDGLSLKELTPQKIADNLHPAQCAISHLPSISLSPQQLEEIRNGRKIDADTPGLHETEIAAFDNHGNLVALLREKQPGLLGPVRNFPSS